MEDFILYQVKKYSVEQVLHLSEEELELMSNRRTIREFSEEPIPQEVIENLIKIASTAPSGANRQPWKFIVVKDKDIKKIIRSNSEQVEKINYESKFPEEMKEELKKFKTNFEKPFLEKAPYIIIVFYEKYKITDNGHEKNYYAMESASIALGFLISSIHRCGLASVVYTPNPMRFINDIFSIGLNFVPFAIVPVGYPMENTKVPNISKKDFNEICQII